MDWETGFVIGWEVAGPRNKPRSICRSVDLAWMPTLILPQVHHRCITAFASLLLDGVVTLIIMNGSLR